MRKAIIIALAIAAGAALNSADAKKKDKKKQAAPVVLASASDTLSYAAGAASTEGLLQYLNQMGVDSLTLDDFIRGYEEAVSKMDDKNFTAYSLGTQIAAQVNRNILPQQKSLLNQGTDTLSNAIFNRAFADAVKQDTAIFTQKKAAVYVNERREAIKRAQNEAYIRENTAWLAANATKEGVVVTPSGLQYKVLEKGTGDIPKAEDKVVVKYEGHTIDGVEFDSSYKRDPQTSTFRCDQVIKGWTEALTMMPVGSKWQIFIPQELAYGERQAGKIKPYSTLIFTVELVSIEK